MKLFKLIRWLENQLKMNFITLRKCTSFNCKFNHAEVCFLREDIDRGYYCEHLMSDKETQENL
jgi:hypothetical protein